MSPRASQGNPEKIQVTRATYEILQPNFLLVERGAKTLAHC